MTSLPISRSWWKKVLFSGQRKARGCHECQDCGREIGPGEYYWSNVTIWRDEDNQRHMATKKSCCRPC